MNTLILYKDGTTESLKLCIDSRKSEKETKAIVRPDEQTIHNVAIFTTNDQSVWLSYFAKNVRSGHVEFIYFRLNGETLVPSGKVFKFHLARTEQQASLIGYCVVDGDAQPSLVTICEFIFYNTCSYLHFSMLILCFIYSLMHPFI